MCHGDTVPALRRLAIAILVAMGTTFAQTPAAAERPDWRKVGNSGVELMLASPATGPVDQVWFAPDGRSLYARTRSGRVFETVDFENWSPASSPAPRSETGVGMPVERLPALNSTLRPHPADPRKVYALSTHLYQSEDAGRTWINLTAYDGESVIGPGQRDLAISPLDPAELVVANDRGLWRSMDGGLSWSGLNQFLPNLMVRRILATPANGAGTRIDVEGVGAVEWVPGNRGGLAHSSWQPVPDLRSDPEAEVRRTYSTALEAEITAVAAAGDVVYAGAADGRIWVSTDRGRTWNLSRREASGAIESFYVDPRAPRVALAAVAGAGTHVLRTTNMGANGFWDDLTASLPDVAAHAVAADRAAGAVYVATDRGVFFARADLEAPGPVSAWTTLTDNLPAARAIDVKLDAAGNQLYVALEGYGVYAAMAPHRARTLRLVNAADLSTRPAAPGSLLSVLGGRVRVARAGNLEFPVLASSETGSQIQVPFEVSGPSVLLALEAANGRVSFGLPVQTASPAIFVDRDGAPMLLDADSGLMLDAGNTAHSGSRIQILATGLGRVRPDWPTGLAAPLEGPPAVAATVRAYVDRAPVEVTRATLAPGYIGFYLIELQLPALVNAGPAELYVTADGQDSNRVRVYLEP